MVSIAFGVLAVLAGLYGMKIWSSETLHFLKGLLPISLFFAGLIAIIAGASRSSTRRAGKDHDKA